MVPGLLVTKLPEIILKVGVSWPQNGRQKTLIYLDLRHPFASNDRKQFVGTFVNKIFYSYVY